MWGRLIRTIVLKLWVQWVRTIPQTNSVATRVGPHSPTALPKKSTRLFLFFFSGYEILFKIHVWTQRFSIWRKESGSKQERARAPNKGIWDRKSLGFAWIYANVMVSQEEPSPSWILPVNHGWSKLSCCFPDSQLGIWPPVAPITEFWQ